MINCFQSGFGQRGTDAEPDREARISPDARPPFLWQVLEDLDLDDLVPKKYPF